MDGETPSMATGIRIIKILATAVGKKHTAAHQATSSILSGAVEKQRLRKKTISFVG